MSPRPKSHAPNAGCIAPARASDAEPLFKRAPTVDKMARLDYRSLRSLGTWFEILEEQQSTQVTIFRNRSDFSR
jgi:hypothetical protein